MGDNELLGLSSKECLMTVFTLCVALAVLRALIMNSFQAVLTIFCYKGELTAGCLFSSLKLANVIHKEL